MFNHKKYQHQDVIDLPNRQWPSKKIKQAPTWCSVDLRDGNQALVEPMNVAQKLEMFKLLVDIGFKDIEIGFPSASQTDFDFTRMLIEKNLIPEDVCIQVLVQARDSLIAKTFLALEGVKQAIVHVYNSTSTLQRQRVFEKSKSEINQLAIEGSKMLVNYAKNHPQTNWHFQYSPESFSQTEMPFALQVCNSVLDVFFEHKFGRVIINLPATVEVTSPNLFADQVEYIHQNINYRNQIELSLHTHNDRGCGVAAAELGLLAGADRLEGTLFGNGERTGNMDLITSGMNLYSQGIDPNIDLSDVERMKKVYQMCCQLPVSPRHPWVGDLVYTAFSGSHQDAINKSMAKQKADEPWQVAYLPIDPRDLGCSYEALIQINSQSGKGGLAWMLKQYFGIELPKAMLIEFSEIVQKETDGTGSTVDKEKLWQLLRKNYFATTWQIEQLHINNKSGNEQLTVHGLYEKKPFVITAQGQGVLNTWLDALEKRHKTGINVINLRQYSQNKGNDSQAISIIEAKINDKTKFAIGMDADTAKSPLLAACGLL